MSQHCIGLLRNGVVSTVFVATSSSLSQTHPGKHFLLISLSWCVGPCAPDRRRKGVYSNDGEDANAKNSVAMKE